jgi:hypothetical protein
MNKKDKGLNLKIQVTGEASTGINRTALIESLEIYDSAVFDGDVVFTGVGKRGGTYSVLRINKAGFHRIISQYLRTIKPELVCTDCGNEFEYNENEGSLDEDGDALCGDCVHAQKH